MRTLYLKISLNQLYCHDKPDAWGDSDPYMWNIFFKIDGSCVHLNDSFHLEGSPVYHYSEGSHGNLLVENVESGQRIGIPKEVGEWKTPLVPIALPYFGTSISGVAGVVSVLMEKNYVSLKGAEAGHKALNDYVTSAIDASIVGFDPEKVDIHNIDSSIKGFFDAQVREFEDKVGTLVGAAVSNAQTMVQNILSMLKRDVVIGYRIWDFSNAGIEKENGVIEFKQRWAARKYGDFEVSGRLTATIDPEEGNAIKSE